MTGTTFVLEESTGGEFELIPDNQIVQARVAKVDRETTKMKDEVTGEFVEQIVFKFVLLEDDWGEGRAVWGRTSTKFSTHENCRLHAWVLELMGVNELPTGFRLDLQDLVGNECRVAIEVNTWEDKKAGPDPDTGEIRYKSNNRVKDVIRARAATQARFDEEPF